VCPSRLSLTTRALLNGYWWEGAREHVKEMLGSLRRIRELKVKAEELPEDLRMLVISLKYGMGGGGDKPGTGFIGKEVIPFSVGLAAHAKIIMEADEVPEDFADTVAEFTYIFSVLMPTRYVWHPSDTAGPQNGEWPAHVRFLHAMLRVSETEARAYAEERADWDEDDDGDC